MAAILDYDTDPQRHNTMLQPTILALVGGGGGGGGEAKRVKFLPFLLHAQRLGDECPCTSEGQIAISK